MTFAAVARHNQRSTIEDCPREVREYIVTELSKDQRDPSRKTFREISDHCGVSKSTLGRYSRRLYREKIYRHKLDREQGMNGRRIVVRLLSALIISTTFDRFGNALPQTDFDTTHVDYIEESQLRNSDLLLTVTFKTSPIKNPAAIRPPEPAPESQPDNAAS